MDMTMRVKNEKLAILGIVLGGLVLPLGGLIVAVILNLTMFRDHRSSQRTMLLVGAAMTVLEVLIFGLGFYGLQRR